MQKKVSVAILLLLLLLFGFTLITGCADNETNGESGIPSNVGLTSSGVGSAGHTQTVAYAPLLEKYLDARVRVLPAWSAAVNLSKIKEGIGHINGFGMALGTAYEAFIGNDVFASHEWGPQDVSIVWYDYSAPYGIAVAGNSNIQTMEDLKGKRMAYYSSAPSWVTGIQGALAFAGLTMDDVQVINVGGYDHCARAIAEGRADFTYLYTGSSVTYEIEESPNGIRWISMPHDDEEGWARYMKLNPMFPRCVANKGVKSAAGVEMANHPFVIWTYKDMHEELVYELAKFYVEEFDNYKDLNSDLVDKSLETVLAFFKSGNGLPVHPGTVKFLKEIDEWDESDDKWNEEQWVIYDNLKGAWDSATDEAIEKDVPIEYENSEWLEIWHQHRDKVELPVQRNE